MILMIMDSKRKVYYIEVSGDERKLSVYIWEPINYFDKTLENII